LDGNQAFHLDLILKITTIRGSNKGLAVLFAELMFRTGAAEGKLPASRRYSEQVLPTGFAQKDPLRAIGPESTQGCVRSRYERDACRSGLDAVTKWANNWSAAPDYQGRHPLA